MNWADQASTNEMTVEQIADRQNAAREDCWRALATLQRAERLGHLPTSLEFVSDVEDTLVKVMDEVYSQLLADPDFDPTNVERASETVAEVATSVVGNFLAKYMQVLRQANLACNKRAIDWLEQAGRSLVNN